MGAHPSARRAKRSPSHTTHDAQQADSAFKKDVADTRARRAQVSPRISGTRPLPRAAPTPRARASHRLQFAQQCRAAGTRWTDPRFKPGATALVGQWRTKKAMEVRGKVTRWLRPSMDGFGGRAGGQEGGWSVFNGNPRPEDVDQVRCRRTEVPVIDYRRHTYGHHAACRVACLRPCAPSGHTASAPPSRDVSAVDRAVPRSVAVRWSPLAAAQGALDDCWFLSALCVLAHYPELVKRLLVTPDFSPEGIYAVRLCYGGEWKVYWIDDYLPCGRSGHPLFASPVHQRLWVPLVEKARRESDAQTAAGAVANRLRASACHPQPPLRPRAALRAYSGISTPVCVPPPVPPFAALCRPVPPGARRPQAFAKAHGTYTSICSGNTREALAVLTGLPTAGIKDIHRRDKCLLSDEQLFARLARWCVPSTPTPALRRLRQTLAQPRSLDLSCAASALVSSLARDHSAGRRTSAQVHVWLHPVRLMWPHGPPCRRVQAAGAAARACLLCAGAAAPRGDGRSDAGEDA